MQLSVIGREPLSVEVVHAMKVIKVNFSVLISPDVRFQCTYIFYVRIHYNDMLIWRSRKILPML